MLLVGEVWIKPEMYKNYNSCFLFFFKSWVSMLLTSSDLVPSLSLSCCMIITLHLEHNTRLEGTLLTWCLCDLAETWSTDRRPAPWFSTCLWVCTASAAKIPSTTCWTMCGPTCLRRRLTSSRPSWEPWKDWGLPSGPAACCSTAYRWGHSVSLWLTLQVL